MPAVTPALFPDRHPRLRNDQAKDTSRLKFCPACVRSSQYSIGHLENTHMVYGAHAFFDTSCAAPSSEWPKKNLI